MVNIQRVRVTLTGFPGGPGVSTFYGLEAYTLLHKVRTFYDSVKAYFPDDVTFGFPNSGDVIDPLNGDLMGTWTAGAETDVVGTGADPYAAPVGAVVNWITGDVLDGHRLRGKTYLVPLVVSCFDLTGSLDSTVLAALIGDASAFASSASGNLVVWHRPRDAKAADGSRKAVTARAGGYSIVTASSVPDKAAILRSRRD